MVLRLQMVSEVGWKTRSNNLNWSAGGAMCEDCGSAADGYASDFCRLVRGLRFRGGFDAWNIVADLHGTLLPNNH